MSDITHIAFYPSDWLGGTRGLTAAETGVYITLVCMMYERQAPLKVDKPRLARICGLPASKLKGALETLLDEGKIVEVDGGLWNDRVGREIGRVRERSSKARDSAKARWKSHGRQIETVNSQSLYQEHDLEPHKKPNEINY